MSNLSHEDGRRARPAAQQITYSPLTGRSLVSGSHVSLTSRLAFALLCALAFSASQIRAQGIGTSAGGASVSPSSPGADATRGHGAISVRVIDDAGQPVRNAQVSVSPVGRPQFTRPNFDGSARGAGEYDFIGLDAGLYNVSVTVPGYVAEPRPAPPDYDASGANNPPTFYRPGDSVTVRVVKGGVITGRVTDAEGNPVVGARVNVAAQRTLDGQPLFGGGRERRTDDRGVYRLYGLSPAVYVVYAGGRLLFGGSSRLTPYDADVPTYYPSSSSREGAVEVQVQAGQEVTDVDIRYRGDKGHSVSGSVAGVPAPTGEGVNAVTFITLTNSATGWPGGQTIIPPNSPARAFSLDVVADGEYELSASTGVMGGDSLAATPIHVSVHGADVSGLRLTLAPLGYLAGRVTFEPLKAADAARPECKSSRPFAPQEMIVFTGLADTPARQQRPVPQTYSSASPDDKGEFLLRNLRDGRYRFGVQLLDDSYYLRAATTPAPAPSANTSAGATNARGAATNAADAGQGLFQLGPGQKLGGALLTISAGAASLRGRVVAGEGEALPEGLRVYLFPSERERAADALRYSESAVRSDGTFAFRNLAPGDYLLLARPAPEADARRPRLPFAFDPATRAALRRDAEASKTAVTLQPCQRTDDFTLRLARQ